MPRIEYRLPDGARLTGTTTILGRFKDSGGLIHWAWTEGAEGRDYRDTRERAATAGTIAHEMIEAEITGFGLNPTQIAEVWQSRGMETEVANARRGFEGFQRWREQTRLRVLHTEVSLVSDNPSFGGTMDGIGVLEGVERHPLIMFDWKTSNSIYEDYLCQLAAYRHLWEHGRANNGKDGRPIFDVAELQRFGEKIEEIHLLRVDKEWGGFHHHAWPLALIDLAWEAFRRMAELYPITAKLKRAL